MCVFCLHKTRSTRVTSCAARGAQPDHNLPTIFALHFTSTRSKNCNTRFCSVYAHHRKSACVVCACVRVVTCDDDDVVCVVGWCARCCFRARHTHPTRHTPPPSLAFHPISTLYIPTVPPSIPPIIPPQRAQVCHEPLPCAHLVSTPSFPLGLCPPHLTTPDSTPPPP